MRVLALVLALMLIIAAPMRVSAADVSTTGDVDGDGKVTIMDATAIQRYLVDAPEEPEVYNYEPIEYNFIPILEMEEVGDGEDYKIYSSEELTTDILTHRAEGNTLIVERVFAQITHIDEPWHDTADAKIIGTDHTIKYGFFNAPVYEGTIMMTYLIYNPNNDYTDDVVNRYDYVLDRRFEVHG